MKNLIPSLRMVFIAILFISSGNMCFSQVITSISPTSGPVGTSVTINGTGFFPFSLMNSVLFGAVKATVTSATSTSVTFTVPVGGGSVVPIQLVTQGWFTNVSTIACATPFFTVTNTPNLVYDYLRVATNPAVASKLFAIGDFNRDGIPDVAFDNQNAVRVCFGDGNGSFTYSNSYAVGNNISSIITADLDADGVLDIVTSNADSRSLSVLWGNSNGTFNTAVSIGLPQVISSVAVADFNRDGRPDLLTTNKSSNDVTVFINNSSRGFNYYYSYVVGTSPEHAAVGDFNGDGKADVVVTNKGTNTISVLLGDGKGGLGGSTNYVVGTSPYYVALGDFNGDGKTDIAVTVSGDNKIAVLLGNGNGTFATAVKYDTNSLPIMPTVCDYNGDGKSDIAFGCQTAQKLGVITGKGNGTFYPAKYFAVWGLNHGIATADFNCDGRTDFGLMTDEGFYSLVNLPVPAITSFSPTSGEIGTSVTITGTSFSAVASENSVYFGDVKATVTLASSTSLTVIVPAGGGSVEMVSVSVNGKVANSLLGSTPFFTYSRSTKNYLGFNFTSLSTGSSSCIGTGDFNGDGKPDIAVGMFSANSVNIYLGDGNGNFSLSNTYTVGTEPYRIESGDFNGDGILDLVTANAGSANVSILLGNGNGSFGAATNYTVGETPIGVTVGDLDSDGKADIVVANVGSDFISILTGIGNGTFNAAINCTVGAKPGVVKLGDFNGDKNTDIAVINFGSSYLSILYGNGVRNFAAPVKTALEDNPYSFDLTDLNNDGKTDIILTGFYYGSVMFLLSNGNGTFEMRGDYLTAKPEDIATGDFNGDGKTDIVLSYSDNADYLLFLMGDGTGNISDYTYRTISGSAMIIKISDFNKDGRADIAINNDGYLNIILGGLDTPTANAFTNKTTTGFDFSWSSPTGSVATGYYLDIATDASFTHLVNNSGLGNENVGNTLSKTITGLTPATTYYCRVRAYNAQETSANSNVVSDFTLLDLKISNITPSQGAVGTTITINGAGFSTTPANNVVYFGAVKATVTAATTTTLTLTVPAGAGSVVPILVTVNNHVARSITGSTPFFTITNTPTLTADYSINTITQTDNNNKKFVLADFNRDGKADLATTQFDTKKLEVSLGNGNGTFGTPTVIDLLGYSPRDIATGDFNGDGKIDLVVAGELTNYLVMIFGNGDGTFATAFPSYVDASPFVIAVADFNNDGKDDIAIGDYWYKNFSVSLGNGTGGFALSFKVDVPSPAEIKIADFDNDGNADVILCSYGYNYTKIFQGFGNGTFQMSVLNDYSIHYYFFYGAYALSVGDFNNDGFADVVFKSGHYGGLCVMLGNGNFTFTLSHWWYCGNVQTTITGDFNGDGNLDFAHCNFLSSLEIVLGYGTGRMGEETSLPVPAGDCMYFCDLNNDGKADLVTTTPTNITVCLNKPPDAPVATAAFDISSTGFTATWNANSVATNYYIDVSTDENFSTFVNNGGAGNEETGDVLLKSFSGLTGGTTYYYRLRATNGNGTSVNSNVISLTTPLNAPVATAATDITTNSLTANWAASNGAIGYYLDVASDINFTTLINNGGAGNENVGNVLSKSISGLSTGTTYFYRVRAYNATTTTASSNAISCETTKNSQTISFTSFSTPLTFGAAPFDLTASATSGLTVSFASDNTSIATVSGNTVTIVGVGTANITASQAGDANYYAASDYVRQLVVLANTDAPGNALIFNSSNSIVNLGNSISLTSNFTIETWILPQIPSSLSTIISNKSGACSTSGFSLVVKPDGSLNVEYGNCGGFGSAAGKIAFGKWQHVAYTVSSTGSKLYINGIEVASEGSISVGAGATDLLLGDYGNVLGWYPYKGNLDELRIWNTALSATQLQSGMYNVISPSSSGLTAYYRCDQSSGSTLYDLTSNAHNGNLVNTTWTESYAMVVPVPQDASATSNTSFTANWNAPLIGSVSKYIFDVSTTSNFTTVVSGFWGMECGTNTSQLVTGLSPNTAYYYRVRANKTETIDQEGGFYRNTISVTTLKTTQSITFSPISTPVILGVSPLALTASASSGLDVSFTSDNETVATVSGNMVTVLSAGIVNITASQAGNSTFAPATNVARTFEVLPNMTSPGNALTFNGISDFATVPYNFSGFTSYTLEAWIKPSSIGNQTVIAANNGSNYTSAHQINIYNGKFQHYTWAGSAIYITGTTDIQVGKWYHVAITATNGGYAHLFVNGVEEGTPISVVSLETSGTQFYIGKSGFGTAYFNGAVDEVRIWNFAKDGTAIQNSMYNTVNQSSTGLVSYYKFDQTTGTALYDLTSSANHGTISNSNWTESYAMIVPTPQAADNILNNSFTAHWDAPAVGTVEKYLLDVSTTSDFSSFVSGYSSKDCGTNLSQSVSSLSAGITYYYRVRAEKSSVSGQGGLYRNTISVSTPKANQSINFATIASPATLGVTPITLSATATSGLDVTLMSDNPSVATVSGTTLTIVGGGIVHITASQSGNTNFNAATDVSQTLTVNLPAPGNALHFEASKSNSVNCGSILNTATAFTIEGWIKPEENFGPNTIFASKNTGCTTGGFALYINSFNTQDNALVVETDNCGSFYTAGNAIKMGVWQHIALVVSSFTSAKLYINGVEQTTYGSFAMTTLSAPLTLGDFSGGGSHFYYKGAMDEVRVWNSARLATDIQNNMFNPLLGSEDGLISYYNFDIGSAGSFNSGLTMLYDKTSHANNGTLSNFTLNGGSSNWVESYAMVVPVPQAATDVQTTSFTAHWNAPTVGTVTNYLLDVSTSSTFSSFVEGYLGYDCGTNLSKSVTGLSQGTTYYYRVTANKSSVSGQGRYSGIYTSVTTIATQTILFSAISSPIIMGASPISLSAIASSGLTVSFASDNEAVATVSGNTLSIVGAGTVNITASQTGNAIYTAAPNVVRSFEVLPNMTAPGNALNFNPTNTSTVNCGSILNDATAFTVEAWIKPESNSGPNTVFASKYTGCSIGGFALYVNSFGTEDHALVVETNSCGTLYTAAGSIKMGQWQHIALVVNSLTSAKLYINGVEQTTTGSIAITTLAAPFTLGDFSGGGSHFYFKGAMDEVRVWKTALSTDEIQSNLYHSVSLPNSGLTAYYKFDQTTGNTLYDASNANHGTIVNTGWVESYAMVVPVLQSVSNTNSNCFTANWTAPVVGTVTKYLLDVSTSSDFSSFVTNYNAADCGTNVSKTVSGLSANTTYYYRVRADKTSVTGQGGYATGSVTTSTPMTAPGNALTFNGINEYATVPYNFSGFTTYTIEAWIKPASLVIQTVLAANNGSGFTSAHQINIYNGKFQHYTWAGTTININGTTDIQVGKWYHVAITATNDGYAHLFVNGVEEGTPLPIGTLETSGTQFYIGRSGFGDAYFSGSVDEVRFWNFAKEGTAIQSSMYNVVNQASTGLISYYQFDQTSGNTLYDLTSNANNGTVVNPNWTESYAMVEPIATAATDISKVGFTANWTVPAKGNAPTD
ncbi:MAG: FG-GAP-like repeat-containing protein, partial [Mariniphaga sp.]